MQTLWKTSWRELDWNKGTIAMIQMGNDEDLNQISIRGYGGEKANMRALVIDINTVLLLSRCYD